MLGYLGAAVPLSAILALLLGWQKPSAAVLAALGILLVLSPLAFIVSRRWVARLDEIEDYHHRGSLADDLIPSQFSARKLTWLSGIGALFGVLIGSSAGALRAADASALWVIAGGLVGALAGALLAAEGNGGPALSGRFWRGGTLATSPTFAVLRSLLLLLAGSFLGLMIGSLTPPGGIRPESGVAGALIGLLMSSESHRWLSLRLRWVLMQIRLAAWPILGAFTTLCLLALMRSRVPWTLLGYGHLAFRFQSLASLLWFAIYAIAGILGALGGLWAADGAGQPLMKALRLFVGLAGVLLLVTLPVYIIIGLVTGSSGAAASTSGSTSEQWWRPLLWWSGRYGTAIRKCEPAWRGPAMPPLWQEIVSPHCYPARCMEPGDESLDRRPICGQPRNECGCRRCNYPA